MGANVVSDRARAVVIAAGWRTYFGSLAKAICGTRSEAAFDRGVNSVSRLLIRSMLVMVPLPLAYFPWLASGGLLRGGAERQDVVRPSVRSVVLSRGAAFISNYPGDYKL